MCLQQPEGLEITCKSTFPKSSLSLCVIYTMVLDSPTLEQGLCYLTRWEGGMRSTYLIPDANSARRKSQKVVSQPAFFN